MTPARKKRWFEWLFSRHVSWRMRRHFSAFYVQGALPDGPVLLSVSHSSWWDSLVCFQLLRGRDGYAMMDERSLHKLPFLGWIGGFGVRLGDKQDGARALGYARERLAAGGVVVMFPQGREQPLSMRPLGFKPGLERLSEPAVPLVLRYEHLREEKPVLLASFGAAALDHEAAMLRQLAQVEAALHDGSFRAWPARFASRASRWVGA